MRSLCQTVFAVASDDAGFGFKFVEVGEGFAHAEHEVNGVHGAEEGTGHVVDAGGSVTGENREDFLLAFVVMVGDFGGALGEGVERGAVAGMGGGARGGEVGDLSQGVQVFLEGASGVEFSGTDVGRDAFENMVADEEVFAVLESDVSKGVAGGVVNDQRKFFPGEDLGVVEDPGSHFGDGDGGLAEEFSNGVQCGVGSAPGAEFIGEEVGEFRGAAGGVVEDFCIIGMNPDFGGALFDDGAGEADVIGMAMGEDQAFDLFETKSQSLQTLLESRQRVLRVQSGVNEGEGFIFDEPGVDFTLEERIGKRNPVDSP